MKYIKSIPLNLLFFSFILLAVTKYNGNYHPAYIDMYSFMFDRELYANDIYLQNTFIYQSSILYKVFLYFGINLDNDLYGFSLYFFFASIATYSVYLILKRHIGVSNNYICFLFILPLLVIDQGLIESSRGGILISHTGSPTLFAHFLIFPLILLVLEGKYFITAALSSIMLLIQFKVLWFPIALVSIYSLVVSKKKIPILLYLFLPLLSLIYLLLSSELELANKLQLVDIVIQRDWQEDIFFVQPAYQLFIFISSFILFYIFSREIKNQKIKIFLYILLLLTVINFLLGSIYTSLIYKYFPDPRLFLISPVRATSIYHFFFLVVLLLFTFNIKTHWSVKSLFYSSVFYFGYAHSYVNIFISDLSIYSLFKNISIIFLIMCFLIHVYLKLMNLKFNEFENQKKIFYSSYLIILPVIIIFFTSSFKNYDYDMFKENYRWTNKMYSHKELANTAKLFSSCDDFLLLVLHEQDRWDTFGNKLAKKSKFLGDFSHFYFNYPLYEEHMKRRDLVLDLWRYHKTSNDMYKDTLEKLQEYNLVVLTYSNIHSSIQDSYTSLYNHDGIGAYFIGKNKLIGNAIKECIK
jgi:hypothetical protein